jgi:hypothetical protein
MLLILLEYCAINICAGHISYPVDHNTLMKDIPSICLSVAIVAEFSIELVFY